MNFVFCFINSSVTDSENSNTLRAQGSSEALKPNPLFELIPPGLFETPTHKENIYPLAQTRPIELLPRKTKIPKSAIPIVEPKKDEIDIIKRIREEYLIENMLQKDKSLDSLGVAICQNIDRFMEKSPKYENGQYSFLFEILRDMSIKSYRTNNIQNTFCRSIDTTDSEQLLLYVMNNLDIDVTNKLVPKMSEIDLGNFMIMVFRMKRQDSFLCLYKAIDLKSRCNFHKYQTIRFIVRNTNTIRILFYCMWGMVDFGMSGNIFGAYGNKNVTSMAQAFVALNAFCLLLYNFTGKLVLLNHCHDPNGNPMTLSYFMHNI